MVASSGVSCRGGWRVVSCLGCGLSRSERNTSMSLSNSPRIILNTSSQSLVLAAVLLDTRGPPRLGPVSQNSCQTTAPSLGDDEDDEQEASDLDTESYQ